jgi:hypothetical protein
MNSNISVVVVLVLLSGCVRDVANRYYVQERYPAVPVERVQVLTMAPARPYVLLADFQSRGDSEDSLRHKAAEIGADAVIVTKFGGSSPRGQQWAENQTTYHDSQGDRIVGTAIRYKE